MENLEARRLLANSIYAFPGADGHMLYKPLPLGDRVEEYSTVGYKGGTVTIPDLPVKANVSPIAGDNTANIQNAINAVAALPLDANGFRGAVLLAPGTYPIDGVLNINASGVVLRGSGEAQTIIYGTTSTDTTERTLINVNGSNSMSTSNTRNIVDKYVPVGAISFTVNDSSGFAVGDTVIIHRPSTQQWINDMGMNLLSPGAWTPGSKDINMDRTITHIDGNVITVDAPITQALDLKYTDASQGTNTIYKYTASGRLSNVGIEYIGGVSQYNSTVTDPSDGPVDENHPWTFINIDGAINSWARNIESQYFGYSCVYVTNSKYVTVQDSECLDPVSQITGGRRYSFNIDGSQDVLFRNCYTREGRHDYVEGSTVTGPNVFVDDRADATHADAGPHHRYSTAALWDNVYSGQIAIQDRGNSGSGHGHSGANQVIWNSTGTRNPGLIVQSPVTAQNWLIGSVGIFSESTAGPVGFHTPALIDSLGTNVSTRSLYYQQLSERMAYENFALREMRLGDNDAFVSGDTADAVPVDATWKSAIQSATGKTGVGFDDFSANHLVPFTFNYTIDPGTYVVGASLSLGLKSTGGSTGADRIYIESASRSYTFADLGVTPPTTTEDGVVIDLSRLLPALQDGKLNLAIVGNSAIDWAALNFQTGSTTSRTSTTLNPVADAYVRDGTSANTNFGTATTLVSKLDATNNQRESFLKFDLSALSGYVMRAAVRLVPTTVGYSANTRGSGKAAMFNQVSFVADDTWTETGINWNNKPASNAAFAEFLPYLNSPENIDVTSLVQAALAGDKKLSLRLASITQDANGEVDFGSRENSNANLRPQLIIDTFNASAPIADAYVRDGSSAGTNFGTATDLSVKLDTSPNSGNNRDAYLKFDLTGVATAPAGATVRLVPISLGAPATPGVANFVTDDSWTESGITWNNKPAYGPALATWPLSLSAPSKFDVTPQVGSAIAGDKLLSLRVSHNVANSGVNQYASREWADPALRPLLVLRNLAPQITSIGNVVSQVNQTSGPLWFGIWDAETALASLNVSATSSNTTLLPNGNITFGGSGIDRTFTLTPAANQTGSSNVTITVTDAQGQTASAQFTYIVSNTTQINGDQDFSGENDSIRIVRSGSFIDVYRNNPSTPIVHTDYASASQIAIGGLAGDDTITVDFTGGNPIPAAGLSIDTGSGAANILSVVGASSNESFSLTSGTISVNGASFTYTNAQELDLQHGGGQDTLSVAGNAAVSVAAMKLIVSGGGKVSTAASSTLPDFTDLSVAAGNTFDLNGQNQTIDALDGAGTILNNGAAGATLTLGNASGAGSFSGNLSNGTSVLSLAKTGAGTQSLSGSSSYTGSTSVTGGALRISNPSALGATSGNTTISGGTDTGRVELLGNITVAEPFTIANRTGSGGGNFSPHLLNVSGNNTLTGAITLTSGGSYWTIQSDAGKLTLAGNLANNNTSNTRQLFLRGAGDGEVTGQILQTNVSITQLNKEDSGIWTISGSTSYTGATNIDGGTLRVNSAIDASSGVVVAAGATFIAGTTQSLNGLTINDGSDALIVAGADKVLTTSALSISGSGAFDVADNDLIVDYTGASVLTAVKGWITSGYAGGAWNGPGINSSSAAISSAHPTALGYAEANDIFSTFPAAFSGQSVDSTAVLVRYTLFGDASLDGSTDTTDFNLLAANFNRGGQPWNHGDFNYDSFVDTTDFNLLAANFGLVLPAPSQVLAASPPRAAQFSSQFFNSRGTVSSGFTDRDYLSALSEVL